MLKHRLSWLALLACLHAGSVIAQDRSDFGTLPQAGDAAQRPPDSDKYTIGTAPAPSGSANLPSVLERVDQPEPPLRLRGAKEIELYRTLVPSVALIVAGDAQGSGSLIAMNASREKAPALRRTRASTA